MGVQIKIRPQVENRERFGRLVRPAVWNLYGSGWNDANRIAAIAAIAAGGGDDVDFLEFFLAISVSTSLLKSRPQLHERQTPPPPFSPPLRHA